MGIMDMFSALSGAKSLPSQAVPGNPASATVQPGNLATVEPTSVADGKSGQVPGGSAAPKTQRSDGPKSLAEEFKGLWDAPKQGEGHNPSEPLKFNLDPAKVRNAAKTQDYTKVLTPELLEKITAGGPEAASAMLSAMNAMAQEVTAQSALTNAEIMQAALEASRQNTLRDVPTLVRRQNIGNALREDNPLFANPAAGPILQSLENQLVSKFPDKSEAEIADYAKRYLIQFANEVTGTLAPKDTSKQDGRGKEIDWSQVPVI